MKTRLVAIALSLLCCEISLLSQNMPMMPLPKLGKLVPGDTLSVMILKKPDQVFDLSIDLHLRQRWITSSSELAVHPQPVRALK